MRGYTGNGYTVDRWSLYTDGGSTTIPTGYLDIYSTKQYGAYLAQKIDPELAKALAGKTVTYSVLAADGDTAFSANINKSGAYLDSFPIEPNAVSCKTWTFPTDSTDVVFNFAGNAAGHVRPIAAKLELGPTQTLAHKEGDRWVKNEVVNYKEQLLRCCMSTADPSDDYANNKRTPGVLGAVNRAGDTMTGALGVNNNMALLSGYTDSASTLAQLQAVKDNLNSALLQLERPLNDKTLPNVALY